MAGSNLTKEQKKTFGFDINFMLLTCFYNKIACNASDFVYIYDFDYGRSIWSDFVFHLIG